MNTAWYVVKVLPGKERSLNEQFNKDIELGRIPNIVRFVCPTEKEMVVLKSKKVLREKVLYSGYLYFESIKRFSLTIWLTCIYIYSYHCICCTVCC